VSAAYDQAAQALCAAGRTLAARGLTPGTSGNISIRIDGGGYVMSPTGLGLGDLSPAEVARLDERGSHVGGPLPTKEWELHLTFFEHRPAATAIVHVHSSYAVALSCLEHVDEESVLLPLTPYSLMRIGRLPIVPYAPPGSARLAASIAGHAGLYRAILLANHGPIFAGLTLAEAVAGIEEIEQAAKVQLLLHGQAVRPLSDIEIAQLTQPPSG
jgi:ribulose-5-phosphate 4-epimerase/fuculose-1-phosphate aldolase